MGSSVLLTFATDSLGFFIFLGLATLSCCSASPTDLAENSCTAHLLTNLDRKPTGKTLDRQVQ